MEKRCGPCDVARRHLHMWPVRQRLRIFYQSCNPQVEQRFILGWIMCIAQYDLFIYLLTYLFIYLLIFLSPVGMHYFLRLNVYINCVYMAIFQVQSLPITMSVRTILALKIIKKIILSSSFLFIMYCLYVQRCLYCSGSERTTSL